MYVVPLYSCRTDGYSVDIRSGTFSTNTDASDGATLFSVNYNASMTAAPPAPASYPSSQLVARLTPAAAALPGTATPSSVDPPAARVVLSEKTGPSRQIDEDTSDDEIPWRIHKPSRSNWERIHKQSRSNWERIGPSATMARKSTVNRYPKQTARKSIVASRSQSIDIIVRPKERKKIEKKHVSLCVKCNCVCCLVKYNRCIINNHAK